MSHIINQQQNKQPNLNGQLKEAVPNPEVEVVASRRKFSRSYKIRILAEAEQCQDSGEIGALLRREGLYSSHLTRWRQAKQQGKLEAKRGPKVDPQGVEIARLEKENVRLRKELAQAQIVVDIQKKISQLLGLNATMGGEQI